jgi:hypothetical protein
MGTLLEKIFTFGKEVIGRTLELLKDLQVHKVLLVRLARQAQQAQ